jgi:hypothetical protein
MTKLTPAALLGRLVQVRQGEATAMLWSFAYFFCLLCGYYILRPVRDEMGIQGGVENLQWLFTGTFVTMLAAVPLFGWVCSATRAANFADRLSVLRRQPAHLLRPASIPIRSDLHGAGLFRLGQRIQPVRRVGVLELHGRPVPQ